MKKTLIIIIITFTVNLSAQTNYETFKGEKVNVSLNLDLQNSFFKEYGNAFMNRYIEIKLKNKKNDLSTPENTLISYYSATNKKQLKELFIDKPTTNLSELISKNKTKSDTLQSTIRFIHRLTFDYQNKPITFFKYKLIKDSIASSPKLLVMQKQDTKFWKIISNSNFKDIEYAIKKIKTSAFWKFINNRKDKEHPEIEKLKSQVQDGKGVLYIEKLGEVLKKNQSKLKQYLDN